ncbi:MAG: glycoside hydrolase family 127 protein, partial [Candidatus Saccharibacteria bacterium]
QFALHLRVPGWAKDQVTPGDLYSFITPEKDSVSITVNGKAISYRSEKGYAVIDRQWKKGDVVSYSLPMSIRRVKANDKVVDDAGKVAIERGPMVYCLEGADNTLGLMKLMLPDTANLSAKFVADKLNGVVAISGNALLPEGTKSKSVAITAIPYYAWNNRGANEMKVWIPVKE